MGARCLFGKRALVIVRTFDFVVTYAFDVAVVLVACVCNGCSSRHGVTLRLPNFKEHCGERYVLHVGPP